MGDIAEQASFALDQFLNLIRHLVEGMAGIGQFVAPVAQSIAKACLEISCGELGCGLSQLFHRAADIARQSEAEQQAGEERHGPAQKQNLQAGVGASRRDLADDRQIGGDE